MILLLESLKGNVVIAHGRSDAKAIKNAVCVAKQMVEKNVLQAVSDSNQGKSHGGFHFGLHALSGSGKGDEETGQAA